MLKLNEIVVSLSALLNCVTKTFQTVPRSVWIGIQSDQPSYFGVDFILKAPSHVLKNISIRNSGCVAFNNTFNLSHNPGPSLSICLPDKQIFPIKKSCVSNPVMQRPETPRNYVTTCQIHLQ